MRETYLKKIVKNVAFRPGVIRRVRLGPMRGLVYQVSKTTGMSPWYSGSERAHQRVFRQLLQAGDTVIDVGANWGLHTLYFSRLVGPGGLVVAVEPFPPVCAELRWHVQANHCANVKIYELALSDCDGSALFATGESSYTGSLTPVKSIVGKGDQLRVSTRTLDSIVQEVQLKRLRLVKVDVEGAESKVLAGAHQTVDCLRPNFVIDLHTPEQDAVVARQLIAWGYQLRRITGEVIRKTDASWPDPEGVWGTIVAIPSF
jgi:FkbM family methyltransferase